MRPDDLYHLPTNLPVPVDDGAARHLSGMILPRVALPSTDGYLVSLDDPAVPLTVVYCYPRTGRVFPPDKDAETVIRWIRAHAA